MKDFNKLIPKIVMYLSCMYLYSCSNNMFPLDSEWGINPNTMNDQKRKSIFEEEFVQYK